METVLARPFQGSAVLRPPGLFLYLYRHPIDTQIWITKENPLIYFQYDIRKTLEPSRSSRDVMRSSLSPAHSNKAPMVEVFGTKHRRPRHQPTTYAPHHSQQSCIQVVKPSGVIPNSVWGTMRATKICVHVFFQFRGHIDGKIIKKPHRRLPRNTAPELCPELPIFPEPVGRNLNG